MTVSEDGLFDADRDEDNEEESSNCDETRLADGRKYSKGYSEDIEQEVNIDISQLLIELRCQDEGVGRVVQRERKQKGQIDAQSHDPRYFRVRTVWTLNHHYRSPDKWGQNRRLA